MTPLGILSSSCFQCFAHKYWDTQPCPLISMDVAILRKPLSLLLSSAIYIPAILLSITGRRHLNPLVSKSTWWGSLCPFSLISYHSHVLLRLKSLLKCWLAHASTPWTLLILIPSGDLLVVLEVMLRSLRWTCSSESWSSRETTVNCLLPTQFPPVYPD